MTLEQEKGFVEFLPSELSKKKAGRIVGIIELCRKILFLYADQIHWHAQVWYMERFHFSKERLNPSNIVESISFREINHEGNKKYLKEYMRYALGITDMALSNIRTKFLEIRKFLQAFDGEERNVCELPERQIQLYIGELRKKDIVEKTFNGQLYLWCVGLRCSEVCTLEGDAYEWKNGDAWVKVYQIKMKTYKRVPIPEMLYKLMMISIGKYQIQPGEYLLKIRMAELMHMQLFGSRC